jgi:hypothetical protein
MKSLPTILAVCTLTTQGLETREMSHETYL